MKLTTARRNRMPDSAFGIPSERKYPIDTRGRAANAKARAAQQANAGNISMHQKNLIVAKANKKLGTPGK